MAPVIGKTYTWRQVTTHFHGEQTFLAKRNGRIVCATLVATANPEAPEVMIVGTKPRNMQRAEEFCEQRGVIPVFLKHAANEWEFRGFYEFDSYTTDPRRLEKHKPAPRSRLTRVIYLRQVDGPDAGGLPDLDDDIPRTGKEGRKRWQTHLRRERNTALVREKKRRYRAATGGLACEACGFDFGSGYGLPDFCEVHHRVPLAEGEGEQETRVEDLAVLCSNCHRAIHRLGPEMPAVEDLRRRLERQKEKHAETR
jgi:predicted HNH restriction endonuclease